MSYQNLATAIIAAGIPVLVVCARLIAPHLQKVWSCKELDTQQATEQIEFNAETKPLLAFWWDWKCISPFWQANDAAYSRFGYGEITSEDLGLPPELVADLVSMAKWHDSSLNWNYPPDPSPWRQAECDQFNAKSKELFFLCQKALEPSIILIYKHGDEKEDRDLDRYLAEPISFKREATSLAALPSNKTKSF